MINQIVPTKYCIISTASVKKYTNIQNKHTQWNLYNYISTQYKSKYDRNVLQYMPMETCDYL